MVGRTRFHIPLVDQRLQFRLEARSRKVRLDPRAQASTRGNDGQKPRQRIRPGLRTGPFSPGFQCCPLARRLRRQRRHAASRKPISGWNGVAEHNLKRSCALSHQDCHSGAAGTFVGRTAPELAARVRMDGLRPKRGLRTPAKRRTMTGSRKVIRGEMVRASSRRTTWPRDLPLRLLASNCHTVQSTPSAVGGVDRRNGGCHLNVADGPLGEINDRDPARHSE